MDSKTLTVEIITPEKKYEFDGVDAFFAPGKVGKFEILPNHAALVSEIEVGVIKLKNNAGNLNIAVSTGYCEVNKDKIRVLAEAAEKEDEIDIERAKAAQKRAKERLSTKTSDIEVARAEFALKRAINRLKLKS
ncbi:MAG: F0F1 ATP synthase subunit epsilon [Calditrichia bacterium]|nr:F0F1 ATP synthase subunit epsilon [Calditrichia bacterium]